jgi:hypothetical protein
MINFNEVVPNADKETRDFINQFNGFEIEKADQKSVTFTNGIEVSYSLEVSSLFLQQFITKPNNKFNLAIQVVARVSMNGHYMSSWGCMNKYDNALILLWFEEKSRYGQKARNKTQDNAKEEYNRIMKG